MSSEEQKIKLMRKRIKWIVIIAVAVIIISLTVISIRQGHDTNQQVIIKEYGWQPYLVNKTTHNENQDHQILEVSSNAFYPAILCVNKTGYAVVNLNEHPELDTVFIDQVWQLNGTQVLIANQTGLCN